MILKGVLSLVFVIGFVWAVSNVLSYFWALVAAFVIILMLRSIGKTMRAKKT